MKINNPLQMNDWEIRKFFIVIFTIQFSIWGTILLDLIGLNIPILRQLIGFIYLSFTPGILILRILKLHKLGNIETLLYTIGLSLSTLMFTGFFMNITYLRLGIARPISLIPLIATISAVVLALCVICYMVDKDFSNPSIVDVSEILSPPALFLSLIPFLSILGTYLVNFYHTNIILMLMIVTISVIVLLISSDKFVPSKLYPFAIWIIAISLIYHVTLISQYLNINDVITEYHFSNIVIKNSFWDWTIFSNYNSVLSDVILAPIFYHICGLSLTWIFKIIYPLLFSFVSLGVYSIFQEEVKEDKIAFLSAFLFISIIPFISQIPLITKQSIAEIFIVLFLLLIFKANMGKTQKSILLIVFSMSLAVSHYGSSYLIMFSMIFMLFFSLISDNDITQIFYYRKFRKEKLGITNVKNNAISFNFVLVFVVFTVGWYMFISSSSAFNKVVEMGDHIADIFFEDFLSPQHSRGAYMIVRDETSLLRYANKAFYIVTQLLIILGFVETLICHRKSKFSLTYIGFGLYFLLILSAAVCVSAFAIMDPRRLFHLSLFILAPFSVIGYMFICKKIYSFFNKNFYDVKSMHNLYIFFSIFLVIFFLFNTGFIFEISKDHPSSISISQNTIQNYGDTVDLSSFYGNYIVTQDVYSGKWLGKFIGNNTSVYRGNLVQGYPSLTIYGGINESNIKVIDVNAKKIESGYIQITYLNLIKNVGSIWYNPLQKRTAYVFSEISFLFERKNKIYDNGGSNILYG